MVSIFLEFLAMNTAPNQNSQGQRRLGATDLFVSPVALGCWPIAGMTTLDVNDRDSLATIHEAIDQGINFIDTAHCYGADGESEKLIGSAIKGKREDLVLASKGGIHWDSAGNRHYDGSVTRLKHECELSLKRLGVEIIDLYYLHAPDPKVSVGESAAAFVELVEQGKIRTVGVSNFSVEQLNEFQAVCPITAVQPPYNMLQRGIESDIVPWCARHNISIVNYWPLMKGLLAGKIRRGHEFDPNDKRLTYDVFQGEAFEAAQRLLDGVDEIAASLERTVAQVVVNWTLHRAGITSTLCGAKRDWQIRETAGAMGWSLDEASTQRIETLLGSYSN